MSSAPLRSWGNYPPFPQTSTACHWPGDLPAHLAKALRDHGTTLPYGSGLSYGDSCLASSGHVLHVRPSNRFIAADWSSGVLAAEAGVTLEEILEVAIPRGWFLPVTPGTRYVTLGGAVANDVHGKNHHQRGTFGRHVRRFALTRSDAGSLTCSSEQHSELFQATIGGLGLTGVIGWAEIQLVPIQASQLRVTVQRFGDLDEFFALSTEFEASHEFCVSWVDCASRTSTGRGVFVAGNFEQHGTLGVDRKRKVTVPITSPVPLVNRLSLRAFNEVYWQRAPKSRRTATMDYGPFFYPLDKVLKWNRLYGPKGFQQYQVVIPSPDAQAGIEALLQVIARSGTGSFLAVLKRCGDMPSPGLLSFPQAGTTLALDFPHTEQLDQSLFRELDSIVRQANGRHYPAKDAHMSGEDFRRGYPAWERLESLRDRALSSQFWARVTR